MDLYYYHELTLKEIGMVIGVSESGIAIAFKSIVKSLNKLKGGLVS